MLELQPLRMGSLGGTVKVTTSVTTQTIEMAFAGLDPACSGGADPATANSCGVHIHSGKTCSDPSLVGELSLDPIEPRLMLLELRPVDDLLLHLARHEFQQGVGLRELRQPEPGGVALGAEGQPALEVPPQCG